MLKSLTSKTEQSALTHRERDVVQLVAEGYSNKQTARVLDISLKTVETHRSAAMRKLELSSSAALVRYAVRNMLVEP
jgi:DNA-binding NarL/FixJ family response regulator